LANLTSLSLAAGCFDAIPFCIRLMNMTGFGCLPFNVDLFAPPFLLAGETFPPAIQEKLLPKVSESLLQVSYPACVVYVLAYTGALLNLRLQIQSADSLAPLVSSFQLLPLCLPPLLDSYRSLWLQEMIGSFSNCDARLASAAGLKALRFFVGLGAGIPNGDHFSRLQLAVFGQLLAESSSRAMITDELLEMTSLAGNSENFLGELSVFFAKLTHFALMSPKLIPGVCTLAKLLDANNALDRRTLYG
jgi:hypothetical protein